MRQLDDRSVRTIYDTSNIPSEYCLLLEHYHRKPFSSRIWQNVRLQLQAAYPRGRNFGGHSHG